MDMIQMDLQRLYETLQENYVSVDRKRNFRRQKLKSIRFPGKMWISEN